LQKENISEVVLPAASMIDHFIAFRALAFLRSNNQAIKLPVYKSSFDYSLKEGDPFIFSSENIEVATLLKPSQTNKCFQVLIKKKFEEESDCFLYYYISFDFKEEVPYPLSLQEYLEKNS
jgi:hypothetical protein